MVETLKVVTEKEVTTTTTTTVEEKYRVNAPESMQETFMSDSEDEGGRIQFRAFRCVYFDVEVTPDVECVAGDDLPDAASNEAFASSSSSGAGAVGGDVLLVTAADEHHHEMSGYEGNSFRHPSKPADSIAGLIRVSGVFID